jgi:hypothetical protein
MRRHLSQLGRFYTNGTTSNFLPFEEPSQRGCAAVPTIHCNGWKAFATEGGYPEVIGSSKNGVQSF